MKTLTPVLVHFPKNKYSLIHSSNGEKYDRISVHNPETTEIENWYPIQSMEWPVRAMKVENDILLIVHNTHGRVGQLQTLNEKMGILDWQTFNEEV